MQPIDSVEWIDRTLLHANNYNPNHVAPPELRLLKTSILEDGWTQPIVLARDSYEIVDGFHRWTVSGDAEVGKLTDGLVPCVRLQSDEAQQRMSTIRHNRARGTHHVVRMADIVAELVDEFHLDPAEVGARLGMHAEEVERLRTRGQQHVDKDASFSRGWVPKPK